MAEKKGKVDVGVLSVILILTLLFTIPFVYGGFSDIIKDIGNWITGRAVQQSAALNISVASDPPTIVNVTQIGTQSIVEAGLFGVIFNFTANDIDGTSDINSSTATAVFNTTVTDGVRRQNTSCAAATNWNTTARDYICNVTMYWFDVPGTWNVYVRIADNSGSITQNGSTSFTLSSTTAFVMAPATLNWSAVRLGQTNQTSNSDPLTLNNTGNGNITLARVNVTAFSLRGETNATEFINANNFTVDTETGAGNPECSVNTSTTGNIMTNNTGTNITGAGLPIGNYTWSNGTGQEQLYFCLVNVVAGNGTGSGLSAQAYSSSSAWTVRIG